MLTNSVSTYFLATPLGNDKHSSADMACEMRIPSKVDTTTIDVKFEDLPEERHKQFEAQLKTEQEEAKRRLLACYRKTRQGIVEEKLIMPMFTPPNPSTSSSVPTQGNVSFVPNDFLKQFIYVVGNRFDESQKLTQDLIIDMS